MLAYSGERDHLDNKNPSRQGPFHFFGELVVFQRVRLAIRKVLKQKRLQRFKARFAAIVGTKCPRFMSKIMANSLITPNPFPRGGGGTT